MTEVIFFAISYLQIFKDASTKYLIEDQIINL